MKALEDCVSTPRTVDLDAAFVVIEGKTPSEQATGLVTVPRLPRHSKHARVNTELLGLMETEADHVYRTNAEHLMTEQAFLQMTEEDVPPPVLLRCTTTGSDQEVQSEGSDRL